ncbi:MAG: hypothetical protein HKL80_09495 [Acidimicrobiales bacterium]|nr:hypothetical protein [Acidimicrobiales bacterium]
METDGMKFLKRAVLPIVISIILLIVLLSVPGGSSLKVARSTPSSSVNQSYDFNANMSVSVAFNFGTLKKNNINITLGASGAVNPANSSAQADVSIGGIPRFGSTKSSTISAQLVLVGSTIYVKSDLLGNGQWKSKDISSIVKGLNGAIAADFSPETLLSTLGTLGSVTKGSSSVDGGVAVTSYLVNVDLKKLLAKVSLGSAIPCIPDATIPVNLLVDGNGYVRHLGVSYNLSSLIPKKISTYLKISAVLNLSVDFSNFGAPVVITAPNATPMGETGLGKSHSLPPKQSLRVPFSGAGICGS